MMSFAGSFRPFAALAAAAALFSVPACVDDVSPVGGDLAKGEIQIALDSLVWNGSDQYVYRGDEAFLVNCPVIEFASEFEKAVDSRSSTNLLGRLSVPEYGDLSCSFVSRLMCITSLSLPDGAQVDSMKLILSVPRGQLTGDSLAPQQLRAYQLSKSLPSDINNTFDPTGFYDPGNPIGSRSYTLSALGMSDSLYSALSYINIEIPMSKEMALATAEAYEKSPEIFKWPQSFESYFHGIFVQPSFGRGCVANISDINFLLFYTYQEESEVTDDDGNTSTSLEDAVGSVGVFQASPIVLNSNNISYVPSDYLKSLAAEGLPIVTAPGGYRVRLRFPAKELLEIYNTSQSKLSVITGLDFSIPVEEIQNDYGIAPPPYLLMVKTSKLDEFFANNSLPDNKDSFYAAYNSSKKLYAFSSMRQYMLNLLESGVSDDDLDFTLVPVDITLESNASSSSSSYYYSYYSYYYGSSSSATSYTVTKCTPYIARPAMCRLRIDEAQTVFTYSVQQMR